MEALKYIEEKKRRKKIKKTIALLMVLIGLLILFLIKAPIFNINNVKIVSNDNEVALKDDIENKLQGIKGRNIFYVKRSYIESILKDDPYIKDVKVTKALPNNLTVEVKENKKIFTVEQNGNYYELDESGKVLDKKLGEDDLVKLEGITIQDKEIGEKITEDEKILEIIKDFGALINSNTSSIKFSKLDVSNLSNISLYSNEVLIKIGGNFDLSRKLNYAINILKNVDIKKGYIDVSVEGNPVIKEE
ncbi:cell division protein FtsQ/DivIB [Clostridium intestinale]|uniref:FtsQ-type POTRA domain-containing protein n=1 Tax=Clostridium intestinale TaxID=36845 RepID=A0A7D6VSZ0_9CLOT|nr:FtsQ-type POTRA domain-containing protein [Clostridium intestinale]QLY78332.1 FtsQ-type POTRA domain-containing protein [Clostridium intestinale]